MSRREKTEQAILDAFGAQLLECGMSGVGINNVAKRAGVSKELIYRYFDGLPGLMLAWMQGQDFWTSHSDWMSSLSFSQQSPAELITEMLKAQIQQLQGNEALREIRRWELIEHNDITAQLAKRRESTARTFIDRVDGLTDAADVPAIVSILLAGVLYLSLRAKTESQFLGIPIRTPEGWQRLESALSHVVQTLPETLREQTLEQLEKEHNCMTGVPVCE